MTGSEEIIQKEEEGLELLGMEPWALKSIPKDRRIPFLRDAAKLLAKYHHPDMYPEDADKKKHEHYLARVNQIVERVTTDKFALEEALSEFNTVPNTRVGLEVRLQKTSESHSETKKAASNLQNAFDELKLQYAKEMKAKERLASQLQQERLLVTSLSNRTEEVTKQLKFLRSDEGPYKLAEKRIESLKAIIRKRAEYESLGVQTIPVLGDHLEGEIVINPLEKRSIKQMEFDQAKASASPEESIRDLFNSKMGIMPERTQLKGQRIIYNGNPWRIIGSVPFALLRHMEKNPVSELNYQGGSKDKREPKEYEENALIYVVPFLETTSRALTLIKREYEIEGTLPDIYKLVGITSHETINKPIKPESSV